jgi:beta-glucosidase
VYVDFPDAAGEPPLQLKGFDKVSLQPGESKTVAIDLDGRAFSVWDDGWTTKPGCYGVHVGSSSADLPLTESIARAGGTC